jgi:protein tyrosine phosphatase (PTP) superfamily phosphohydrolase (DUF442 family)
MMNLVEWIGDAYRKIKAYFIMLRHNILPPKKLDWITPDLAIGSDIRDLAFLKAQGIGAMIGLQAERSDDESKLRSAGFEYLYLPIKDGRAPELPQIQTMVNWINRQGQTNRKVYMHCAAGVGRAPTMAMAYLVSTGLTSDQALAEIKEKHKDTDPGPRQVEAVREYEATVLEERARPVEESGSTGSDLRS